METENRTSLQEYFMNQWILCNRIKLEIALLLSKIEVRIYFSKCNVN